MISEKKANAEIRDDQQNGGFTLMEVLIAIAVFAVGMLAVGSMQISAVNNNFAARMRTEATILASEKMEELMSLEDYDDPLLSDITHTWPNPVDPNAIYCMEWEVDEDYPLTSTKTITLSVRWTENELGCTNFDTKEHRVDIDFIRADL